LERNRRGEHCEMDNHQSCRGPELQSLCVCPVDYFICTCVQYFYSWTVPPLHVSDQVQYRGSGEVVLPKQDADCLLSWSDATSLLSSSIFRVHSIPKTLEAFSERQELLWQGQRMHSPHFCAESLLLGGITFARPRSVSIPRLKNGCIAQAGCRMSLDQERRIMYTLFSIFKVHSVQKTI
jgi:hypothetical protein